MCSYCAIGDQAFRWGTPFPTTHPLVPMPMPGVVRQEWPVERLREYLDLLKQVKAMEDSIGCPCPEEREKPDYVALFEERIAAMERKLATSLGDGE